MTYEFQVSGHVTRQPHENDPPYWVILIDALSSDEAWGKFNRMHAKNWEVSKLRDCFKPGKIVSYTDRKRKPNKAREW